MVRLHSICNKCESQNRGWLHVVANQILIDLWAFCSALFLLMIPQTWLVMEWPLVMEWQLVMEWPLWPCLDIFPFLFTVIQPLSSWAPSFTLFSLSAVLSPNMFDDLILGKYVKKTFACAFWHANALFFWYSWKITISTDEPTYPLKSLEPTKLLSMDSDNCCRDVLISCLLSRS